MTAITHHRSRQSKTPQLLFGLVIVLMSLWPLYAAVNRLVPTTHADENHCCDRYPPRVIRACIAQMVADGLTPYQYELPGQNKVAVICRLADNRYGVQINRVLNGEGGAVMYEEITTFYQTLSRIKNILTRDGYSPVIALPGVP